MMKTVNRMILTAAAASMAVLPVAAQANTRAGDSNAIYSAAAPGLGRDAEGEEIGGGIGILVAIFAAAAAVAAAAVVADNAGSDDDSQSPGT